MQFIMPKIARNPELLWCCFSSRLGANWENSSQAVFRKSPVFESYKYSTAAWLRRGEIIANSMKVQSYSEKVFYDSLLKIRELTIEPPEIFIEKAIRFCAFSGVALIFIPSLPKTRASGLTRWLSKDKAMIQLSLRYKTNDHLWFTFFHEAGHILHHGREMCS